MMIPIMLAIEKLKKTIQFLKSKTRDFIFEEINWITTYEEDRVPIGRDLKQHIMSVLLDQGMKLILYGLRRLALMRYQLAYR